MFKFERGRPVSQQLAHYDEVLSRLKGLKWGANGNGKAHCPSHDDRNPSLSVRISERGGLLLQCHAKNAKCSFRSICDALGIKGSDCFPPDPDKKDKEPSRIVGTFEYLSEHGEVLYRTVRAHPKTFWQERYDAASDKWVRGLGGLVETVPYHLPELLASTGTICVVEGELKVKALNDLGIVATCNAGGSGKWSPDWGKYFRGRRVAIFPDCDEAGWNHAAHVAKCLSPFCDSVRVVELFGLRLKEDVCDWLQRFHGTRDEKRAALAAAIQDAPFWDQSDSQYRYAMLRMNLARSFAQANLV